MGTTNRESAEARVIMCSCPATLRWRVKACRVLAARPARSARLRLTAPVARQRELSVSRSGHHDLAVRLQRQGAGLSAAAKAGEHLPTRAEGREIGRAHV